MAKATSMIRAALHYQPQHAHYFAENAALFNCVVAFYRARPEMRPLFSKRG